MAQLVFLKPGEKSKKGRSYTLVSWLWKWAFGAGTLINLVLVYLYYEKF